MKFLEDCPALAGSQPFVDSALQRQTAAYQSAETYNFRMLTSPPL